MVPEATVATAVVRRRRGELVGHRDFRLLWGGETVSEVGSRVSELAIPLVAVGRLHATTWQVGVLTAASTAAFLLVGLPAGAWVDRLRRRPVMVAADVGRLLTLGSIPAAAAAGVLGLPQLYLVTLVAGVLTVFFDVAYQSYLPSLVGADHLVEGNAKLAGSSQVAQVAGPSLAGALVQAIGGPYAVALDAVSFAVSAGAVGAIGAVEPAPEPGARGRGRLRREVGEGLAFVLRHRLLRAIAATTATSNFFSAWLVALEVIFLVRLLHTPPAMIGVLFAVASVGGLLAAFVASRLSARIGGARSTILGIALSGGALLVPASFPGPGLALFAAGMFLTAFGSVIYNVNQVSFRQALCPPRLLGRMNATMRFIVWGTLPLGALAGGAVGSWLGVRPTLWLAAVGEVLAIVWLLASPLRGMRDFPTG